MHVCKMDEYLIESLDSKISELVARYEALLDENKELSSKLAAAQRELENITLTNKELQERIDRLQLTSAFENSSKDKAQAKRKISKLISEIDDCIAMLND